MSNVGDLADRKERPAYVRFERVAVEDKAASIREGRYVSKDVDFALVTPAYSKDCVEHKIDRWLLNLEKNVRDGRTPKEWADKWKESYKLWKNGQEAPPIGTPIRGWGIISPAQQEMVIHCNCLTVEDLAATNDEGKRRLGMGATELINKAKAWLASMKDHGAVAIQVAALQQENAVLKESKDSMQKRMDALEALVKSRPQYADQNTNTAPQNEITASDLLDEAPEVKVPKRRGRPPKHVSHETIS